MAARRPRSIICDDEAETYCGPAGSASAAVTVTATVPAAEAVTVTAAVTPSLQKRQQSVDVDAPPTLHHLPRRTLSMSRACTKGFKQFMQGLQNHKSKSSGY